MLVTNVVPRLTHAKIYDMTWTRTTILLMQSLPRQNTYHGNRKNHVKTRERKRLDYLSRDNKING
jgi:hypothetical protein